MRWALFLSIEVLTMLILAGCGRAPSAAVPGQPQHTAAPEGVARENRELRVVPKGLLIVERDVPQTRIGFTPIVNHEAMVVNTSPRSLRLDIESPFPKSLYVVTKFWPAFGGDALLGEPMRFPAKVKVGKYDVLAKPRILTRDQQTVFAWHDVTVPPGDAAIAQYDQYAGPLSQYYTAEGLRVLDLAVATTPDVQLRGKVTSLQLRVRLHNQGKEQIEKLAFDLMLPDTTLSPEGAETPLLSRPSPRASQGLTYERSSTGDGSDQMATGTFFHYSKEALAPGEQVAFQLGVEGVATGRSGISHPAIILQGLSRGERIWPETKVKASVSLPVERFYYRQASISLPAPVLFRFGPKGVTEASFVPPSKPPG